MRKRRQILFLQSADSLSHRSESILPVNHYCPPQYTKLFFYNFSHMCTCLKSNNLLHWSRREFTNISGDYVMPIYNLNSTSWGALLNWPTFLLIPNWPCMRMSPLSMWVFVGYKVLIQSYSSLGLKACVVLSSRIIFLPRPQDVQLITCCFCWRLPLRCRKLGIIF